MKGAVGPSGEWGQTRWSQVLAAGEADPVARRASLEWLYAQYSRPVVRYLHNLMNSSEAEAEEVAQEFFLFLIEREVVARARRESGRFRHFLKSILKNFLVDRYRRASAQRRGGGRRVVPLGDGGAEPTTPATEVEIDAALDREWARHVLETAMGELRRELEAEDRASEFDLFLRYALPPEGEKAPSYLELATASGRTKHAVYKSLQEIRQRLRLRMAHVVAQGVERAEDVDDELEELMALL